MLGRLGAKLITKGLSKNNSVCFLNKMRRFSTTVNPTKELIKVLDKEFEFEKGAYCEVTEKSKFLKSKGYTFEESADGVNLVLSK
mmetsp:Transcript_36901/g.42405  ORF Transcript_36901/g.42405 Transcript_36901/m.42405 type:complete len:85 (+) Transcript_36901:12-266(+)